ncbi:dihydrofolate reductase family protein [Fulvivirga ligni]|uniref:dihydrofolate reductase family protein n=1 Tax=Fulvivirga ligni TaxID=2904246 RepID=UPI001F30F37A|nr:dihydrofolate reductase family protein [Fulvivirga ligni]UII19757.1 dihydrofolate reductase family protein [Fulvivirga ligni]
MSKLKLQVQISIDGFMGGPNGELDWMNMDWSDDIKEYVTALTEPVECMVLGRKLAEGFIPYWSSQPTEEGAEKINNTHKVVFSKTLEKSPWDKTTIASGDLVEEINKLKAEAEGDLIAYGGSEFVSSLIQENLIDEYHLFINPAAIGKGLPLFGKLGANAQLKLIENKQFECGIILAHYLPLV